MRDPVERAKQINVAELIARKNYGKAIDLIRATLERRRRDPLLRRQLAEVLVQAGRVKEAVAVLTELADDLVLAGAAAKAIAVLKKIDGLEPGRADVEEKLTYMISQQERPTPDPWTRARAKIAKAGAAVPPSPPLPVALFPGDMEEIGHEAEAQGISTPRIEEEPPSSAPEETPAPGVEDFAVDEPFQQELMALIEDVLVPERQGAGLAIGDVATAPAAVIETPLFEDFTCEELVEVIRGLRLHRFEPGEIIVTEGEPGDSLFVLTTGAARAYVRGADGRNVAVRRLGEGAFFGEIALLRGVPRTATITAEGGCELLEIDRPTFDGIAQRHPRVWSVLKDFHDKRAGSTLEAAARQARGESPDPT